MTVRKAGSINLYASVAVVALTSLTSPVAAHAEDASGAANVAGVEEIIVTGAKRKFAPEDSSAATKINMDVIDTPQSLSVLSSELMNIVGISNLNSAAALAPSTLDVENEVQVYNDVVSRGFEINPFNGYKLNGMPIVDDGGPIDFGLAERFEIVRGPASIIYGQSDYGATLNVTLKKPKAKRAIAGELGFNIYGGYRALVDITGALTKDERLRGRLIVIYDNAQSSQDYTYGRTTTVAPSLSWDISDNTTLDINVFHSERKALQGGAFGLISDADGNLHLPDIPRSAFMGMEWSKLSTSMDFATAKLTHDFGGNWILSATGAWHHTSFHWPAPGPWGVATPDGWVHYDDNKHDEQTYDYSGDLTLTGDFEAFGQTHSLMVSGFQRSLTGNYFNDCCAEWPLVNIFNFDPTAYGNLQSYFPEDPENLPSPEGTGINWSGHTVTKDSAVAALLLLHPVDQFTVMLGLRYNKFRKTDVDFWDRSISNQKPDLYKNDALNKRVGLVYEVLDDVNIYASYSDGTIFRANQDKNLNALPAETGVQWEFGVKAALINKKLTVAASAFQIKRKNIAIHDPDFPFFVPYSTTIGGQTHKGIELEAIGEPIPGLNIISSYSYLDVSIKDAPNPGMIGKQRANAPHHMVKLYSTYQLLNGPLKGTSFGGGMFYVGKREVDNFGTFQLPAYTRFDLRLGYDAFENVSFSVNAINITDKKIYASIFQSINAGIDYQNRRTVMFKMNFKY